MGGSALAPAGFRASHGNAAAILTEAEANRKTGMFDRMFKQCVNPACNEKWAIESEDDASSELCVRCEKADTEASLPTWEPPPATPQEDLECGSCGMAIPSNSPTQAEGRRRSLPPGAPAPGTHAPRLSLRTPRTGEGIHNPSGRE